MKTSKKRDYAQYHITYSPPEGCAKSWPNGMWALYRINGDEIARRIKWDATDRKVIRRDSWPGYVGGYGSLAELIKAIEAQ